MTEGIDPVALAALADGLASLVELTAGHRNKCLEAGVGEAAADAIAVQVHDRLITLAFKGT
jgi:hypothetical protein